MLRTEDSGHVDVDVLNNNNNINAGETDDTLDDINMNFLPSSAKDCRARNNIRAEWNPERKLNKPVGFLWQDRI